MTPLDPGDASSAWECSSCGGLTPATRVEQLLELADTVTQDTVEVGS